METLNKILEFEILSLSNYTIRVSDLVTILIIILITKLILWVIKESIVSQV